ncbi:MAG TPA: methyltransferase, partial [Caulobacteraceae bacterium]
MNRRQFSLSACAIALAPVAEAAAPSPLLTRIVEGGQRGAANRARDPFRHPARSLAFWGLAPGMTVVEIEPSGGYWTEILAPYLAQTGGRYVAAVSGDGAPFKARFADPAIWGRIEVVALNAQSGPLTPTGAADLVLTARNFHDWMW